MTGDARDSIARPGPGTLFVVATPIGNLGDLSPRALAAIRDADAVLCEDSRVTGGLLARQSVAATMIPLHDHNEAAQAPRLVERMQAGERFVLADAEQQVDLRHLLAEFLAVAFREAPREKNLRAWA